MEADSVMMGFKRVSVMSEICRATIALKSRACVYVEDGPKTMT